MSLNLSIFPALGDAGMERAKAIEQISTELGYHTRIEVEPDQIAGIRSMLCDSATVFDVSRDGPDPDQSPGITFLPTWTSTLPHLLVVCTGYLPLNVVPARSGGAPAYPYPDRSDAVTGRSEPVSDADISGARHPWVSDGNESILVWVQAQLSEIAKSPGRRFSRIEFDRFMAELAAGSDQSVASEPLRELRAEATAWRERWRLPDVVFLSHRSRHYPKVASFAEQLEAGALDGQPKRNVLVLPPGRLTLDGELLSEGRRWMLLGALDDLLRTCSEMWVWESADYLGSWWTLGELVSASYIDDGEHAPLTIGARRPSDRTPTSADRYRVKLSLQDREHLARYFANSRADQISLELSTVQRVERGIFRAGLGRPYLKIVERILCSDKAMEWQRVAAQLAGICVEEFATLREHAGSFDSYRKRIFHPAYNPRFWKDLLVDRPDTCYELSAQSLIAAESHMLRLDQREVAEAVRSNRRAIARDGTRITVRELAPRYLWRPRHWAGMLGGGLDRLPTYVSEM